jgi:hypothetical protein
MDDWRPVAAYGAVVTLLPAIPRIVVGKPASALPYSIATTSAVAVGALLDGGRNRPGAGFMIGYVPAFVIAIVELASTPRRAVSRSAITIDGVAAAPIASGMSFGVSGRF